jgi:CRP/FNR family transcriptional regulator, cyclic AMP receptor protein
MSSLADQLAGLPLFSACSARDLERLAGATDEVTVEAGKVLTTEGTVGREAFVIIDGVAEVRKGDRVETELGVGAHFGELALLDGGPRTATVVAQTEMTLLVLSKPAFNAVLDEIPTLAHKLLVSLARRLRTSEQSLSH